MVNRKKLRAKLSASRALTALARSLSSNFTGGGGKRKTLNRAFTPVLALVCAGLALVSFSGCRVTGSSSDTGRGTPKGGGIALSLWDMSLSYKDDASRTNLIVFESGKTGYSYDVTEDADYVNYVTNGSGKFLVSLTPKEAVEKVKWTIKDDSFTDTTSQTNYSAEADVPAAGGSSFEIIAELTLESKTTVYSITINPPQLNSPDNYYLQLLEVRYKEHSDSSNQVKNFNALMPNYTFTIGENSIATAHVRAVAMSSAAKITLTYNGVAGSEQTGSAEKDISLPAVNGPSIMLSIKVTKGDGSASNTYEVEINPFTVAMDNWSGTVANKLTGGTASDGKTIVGVVARDAAMNKKQVSLASQNQTDSSAWTLAVASDQNYVPVSFIVILKSDTDDNYVSQTITPTIPSTKTGIALNVIAAGLRISDANEFAKLGESGNQNKDFAISNDIDLTGTNNAWVGPQDYSGHFYGNGYNILGLKLAQTSGQAGLFRSLGNGAVVENFTLDVSTLNNVPLNLTGSLYFGGVVGVINNNSAVIELNNIKVQGSLKVGTYPASGYLLVGGLISEVRSVNTLTITRCASELDISVAAGSGGLGVGGLIGRIRRSVTGVTIIVDLTRCYATGGITVSNAFSNAGGERTTVVGGLIGDIVNSSSTATQVTVDECYAAGAVEVTLDVASGTMGGEGVGGLIGLIWRENGTTTATVKNSAALNEKAIFTRTGAGGSSRNDNQRFSGVAVISPTFINNIARKGMLIGAAPGTPSNEDGALDTKLGLAKTDAELKTVSTWTSTLGWSSDVWDFSGVAQGKWPTLR